MLNKKMLKKNIFLETVIEFLQDSLSIKFKRTDFLYIINVFTVTFDQFDASLLNEVLFNLTLS